jgi:heptosyltransferase II
MGEAPGPRLLLVQTAFLGDIVLTTPLLAAARARFPEAYLAFLGTPAGCALLTGLAGVDRFYSYDKRGGESGWGGLKRKAAELAAGRFDTAISAHRSVRTAWLLREAGIARRIGFATTPLPWLYPERVSWDPRAHEVTRNLGLLAPLGGAPEGFEPRLSMPALPPPGPELLGDEAGPRVGLCPGSVWPTKRWPAAGFARVGRALRERLGATVYLIGSAEDAEVAAAVAAELPGARNLAGRTGLRDWVRLLGAMDLIITNDSAPTHIAGGLGVAAVTLFGPTTPAQGFAPWGGPSAVVEREGLGCRPCGKHGARRCPEGHFHCMEWVEPDAVIAAALGLLGGGG